MRRYALVTLGGVTIAVMGVGVGGVAVGKARTPPPVVSLDDGYKTPVALTIGMSVPYGDATKARVGRPVASGKRLVIETISISGSGSGPADQDQGIERVDISNGRWTISVPLDRYSWGSCPGSGDCSGVPRFWQYGGTEAVRAYANAGSQLTATAWHPGIVGTPGPAQTLSINVLGYLVSLPS